MLEQFVIKPLHGCYTGQQFHQYVITGERFANDNDADFGRLLTLIHQTDAVLEAAERRDLLEKLCNEGRA